MMFRELRTGKTHWAARKDLFLVSARGVGHPAGGRLS